MDDQRPPDAKPANKRLTLSQFTNYCRADADAQVQWKKEGRPKDFKWPEPDDFA